MKSEIRMEMEAKIENVTKKAETNIKKCSDDRNVQVEKIKAEAYRKQKDAELKELGETTMGVYESYRKAGFSQEQAWELLKIVVGGSVN